MALSKGRALCSIPSTRALSFKLKCTDSKFRPFSNIKTMNSLQEASTIYKVFKKGGPAFGGWQVRKSISLLTL